MSSLNIPPPYRGPMVCHWVANTHWDREWQYSFQRSRYMLVELLDKLLEIFDRDPDYRSFHLDSQTVPIEDYLEIRPEQEAPIRHAIESGKLVIGPWYTLPDESSVAGESLIRNLLLGHRMAESFGRVPKIGYSPFGWGQISQMPQIYRGFGIDSVAFYRGVNSRVAPRSEFFWEAPDGSRVLASRLGTRMRYNAWFNIQRAAFFNWPDVDDKTSAWARGSAPLRFMDREKADTFYVYAHPEQNYYKERIPAQVERMIRDQDDDWSTPHRLWANGHDLSGMDHREPMLVQDADEAMGERGEVRFSTYEEFQNAVKSAAGTDLPTAYGEMRHVPMRGDQFGYMGAHNISSACVYLKRENFMAERDLILYAEPAAVFAAFLGAPYPGAFIDHAYRWLLQNHGHDSIGGCSRGIVQRDMRYRFRQAREISRAVLEHALTRIAGAIDLGTMRAKDMAMVVYNPCAFVRDAVMNVLIDIPREWNCEGFAVCDPADDAPLELEIIEKVNFEHPILQHPTDVQVALEIDRYRAVIRTPSLPSMGYKTFPVKPCHSISLQQAGSLRVGPLALQNEFLRVDVNSNGTLKITDFRHQRVFDSVGYFKDRGASDGAHSNEGPTHDRILTTLGECPEIALIEDHRLQGTFEIRWQWRLPENLAADRKSRSAHMLVCPITSLVTLRKGQPYVDVSTEVENNVRNHYLKLCFPTGMKTDTICAQTPFDIAERPIPLPEPFSDYAEAPSAEQPMKNFLDIHDENSGFAFLSEGLAGYEAIDDAERTIEIALLRGFTAQMGWWTLIAYDEEDDSQSMGRNFFRYAFMPHAGDTWQGDVWKAAESFVATPHPIQLGGHDKGTEPLQKSFLEIEDERISLVAVKQSEDKLGTVIRLFNPHLETIQTRLRMNGGYAPSPEQRSLVDFYADAFKLPGTTNQPWPRVELVSLEERPEADLKMDSNGWMALTIPAKKIFTIKFLGQQD